MDSTINNTDTYNCIYDSTADEDGVELDFIGGQFNGTFVLKGTVGRWDGTYGGGAVVRAESLSDLLCNFRCDEFEVLRSRSGAVRIIGYHHDGRIVMDVRELNERGEDYSFRHRYDEDRERVEKLFSSRYSRNPRLSVY